MLALVQIPDRPFAAAALKNSFVIGLEDIQDPGNFGSIIRLCDWFGVEHILVSPQTVDCFNAKVVQASMGSIARVSVHYCEDLPRTIADLKATGKSIYATTLHGDDIYRAKLDRDAQRFIDSFRFEITKQ